MPFIFISLLILIPVPVALIYENYQVTFNLQKNRAALIWEIRFRERDSLISAFYCIDTHKIGEITIKTID